MRNYPLPLSGVRKDPVYLRYIYLVFKKLHGVYAVLNEKDDIVVGICGYPESCGDSVCARELYDEMGVSRQRIDSGFR